MERDSDRQNADDRAGGVAALDRGLALLACFGVDDATLSLADLAARTGLYKSTILRLAASHLRAGFLERLPDGRYRLGPELTRLGAARQRAVAPADAILPVMRDLAEASGESVAFYTPAAGARVCLHRVESRHAIRYMVREGDVLPLDRGSGGRVLAAFGGAAGEPYEAIRRAGFALSDGERDPETAGVSAPVFGPGGALAGALTLAGPRARLDCARLDALVPVLRAAAARASRALGG